MIVLPENDAARQLWKSSAASTSTDDNTNGNNSESLLVQDPPPKYPGQQFQHHQIARQASPYSPLHPHIAHTSSHPHYHDYSHLRHGEQLPPPYWEQDRAARRRFLNALFVAAGIFILGTMLFGSMSLMEMRLAAHSRDFSGYHCGCPDVIAYSSRHQPSELCCKRYHAINKHVQAVEKRDEFASYGFQPVGKMGTHNRNPCACPIDVVACACPPSDAPESEDVIDPHLASDPTVQW